MSSTESCRRRQRLESSRIVCGLSNKLTVDEQGKLTGDAWERLPEPRPNIVLEIQLPDHTVEEYFLGPHTPRLRDRTWNCCTKSGWR